MSTKRDGFHRRFIFMPLFNFSPAVGPANLAPVGAAPPAAYCFDAFEPRRATRIRP